MSHRYFLGIDLGTSGCKAGLFKDDVLIATAAEPVVTTYQDEGWAEQDADAWWTILVRIVARVLDDAGRPAVDALAVVGQSDSLVALDGSGRAVHPCMLWMDGRGAEELQRAVDTIGLEDLRRITGLRPGLNFTAPKAAWLARHRPAEYARTAWLVQPKDALTARMTGRIVTDPSSASRTLLFDIRTGRWSAAVVDAFGLDVRRLPPVLASGAEAGRLTREAAAELGLEAGIVVATGAADRAAEALGSGLTGTDTMVSTGTATGIVRAFSDRPAAPDPAVILPAHAVDGQRLAILSQPTSGTVLDWFASLTGPGVSAVDLEVAGSASPPGANGVTVLPFFMGARSIRWDASARGTIQGLTLATSRGDVARAIIEGCRDGGAGLPRSAGPRCAGRRSG